MCFEYYTREFSGWLNYKFHDYSLDVSSKPYKKIEKIQLDIYRTIILFPYCWYFFSIIIMQN